MRKLLFILLLPILVLAGAALAQPYENSSVVGQAQDRVLVTVKEGVQINLDKSTDPTKVGVAALDAVSSRFAVHEVDRVFYDLVKHDKADDAEPFKRVLEVFFDTRHDLQDVIKAYDAVPEVEKVEAVDICKMYDAYLPSDLSASQWYLRNSTIGGGDVRAVGAWNQALGDSNIIVAVIDSGVDWQHPDLGGTHPDKVNGALWTNWAEYYGTPGFDDDSNGKVDDIRGWDFVHFPGGGYPDEDDSNQDNDPSDYESHGTQCAGIVAAIANNGQGIAGTAHGCKVMAVRAGFLPDGEDQGVVYMSWIISAILYASNSGADIINCSWGSTSQLSSAVAYAQARNILLVNAAGNDDNDEADYLGTRSGVLAVAATGTADGKASFSSYGSWVEISAPGVSMYTTTYDRFTGNHIYSSVQGTSFSSPLTAGAAALVWSANPSWTYTQVADHLIATADNIDAENPGYEGLLGAGRVNLLRALGDEYHQFPDEFPTLFDAMNSASEGDVIQIRGDVEIAGPLEVLGGKDLSVLGGYDASYSSRDPENNKTVVTSNLTQPCMRFVGGEITSATVVDGFHFTGGGGTQFSGIPYNGRYGGGVIVNNVSPTLRNLEISGCSVGSNSLLGCGGGMMLNNSSSVLENIHIHGNTGIYGGGLFANNSTVTMTNCVIEDNTVLTNNVAYPPKGGGLYAVDSDLTMTDCSVSGHVELENGGGIFLTESSGSAMFQMTGGSITDNSAKAAGGGLYMSGGTAQMSKVSITGNTKTAASTFMNGGGFHFNGTAASLDSLVCQDNEANLGGGGGFSACPSAEITNSLITGNIGQYFGGGLSLENTDGVLDGNTIAANDATFSGAGGVYAPTGVLSLSNNIIAANTGGSSLANGLNVGAEPSVFSCNDVYGNATSDFGGMADPTGSNGNISADPDFCGSGDNPYNLKSTSPCTPANSGGCDLIGARTSGCGAAPVLDPDSGVPSTFAVQKAFPNPFNPKTTIRFALPQAAHTSVVIYDVAGRKVKTVVDEMLTAQVHDVSWTGDDDNGRQVAAGVYFYMVSSGEHRSVGRMALVK